VLLRSAATATVAARLAWPAPHGSAAQLLFAGEYKGAKHRNECVFEHGIIVHDDGHTPDVRQVPAARGGGVAAAGGGRGAARQGLGDAISQCSGA
jgi:hypothetical protein